MANGIIPEEGASSAGGDGLLGSNSAENTNLAPQSPQQGMFDTGGPQFQQSPLSGQPGAPQGGILRTPYSDRKGDADFIPTRTVKISDKKIPVKKPYKKISLENIFFPTLTRKTYSRAEDLSSKSIVDNSGIVMNYFIRTKKPVQDPVAVDEAVSNYEVFLAKTVTSLNLGTPLKDDQVYELWNTIHSEEPGEELLVPDIPKIIGEV